MEMRLMSIEYMLMENTLRQFKWEDEEIVLDYHYDDDNLAIFVNGENWIEGDNENLDLLINSLSSAPNAKNGLMVDAKGN